MTEKDLLDPRPIAVIEHRQNDYARIVRIIDVSELPHGTKLYALKEMPMSVRAKVRCNAKTGNEVHFTTVYETEESRDKENARFAKATPWGDIRMGIDNPVALEQFEINKEYYVDFTPASKPV